jgi:3-methylcrotonyl-CoA carboxylase beta subunit
MLYDVREIIARIVDASEFEEFKQHLRHDAGLRLRHIHRLSGRHPRQQRHLFSESALKGAHFIELASQRNIPLVFLQNISGFMVGKKARRRASPRTAPSSSPRWRRPTCRNTP